MASPVMLKPILKPPSSIINGMMKLEIVNLDDILTDDGIWSSFEVEFDFILTIHYRFQFKKDQQDATVLYPHNVWQSKPFALHNVNSHNCFWLKVPLFLFSYRIEFNLNIKLIDCETMTWLDDTSVTLMQNIPSMLIESKHSVGDNVQYCVPNAGFVRSGVIIEVTSDDQIKIRTNPHYASLNGQPVLVTIETDKVYRAIINAFCVIDVTDRIGAEIALILATNDVHKANIYKALRDGTLQILQCLHSEMIELYFDSYHQESVQSLISSNIYQFLYAPQYQYRVDCLFDGTPQFYEEQWKYHVLRTYHELRKGVEMNQVQNARDGHGYTCDLCRIEMNWYQYMYHCGNEHQHDFCVSCIHGIIQQRNTIEQYITELLNGKLDDDCIEQIVEFCIGRVLKFAHHVV